MSSRESELPSGDELAKDLDSFFKAGGFRSSPEPTPAQVPVPEPLRQTLMAVFFKVFFSKTPMGEPREEVAFAREKFSNWRIAAPRFNLRADREEIRLAVKEITLSDLASFATEQFEVQARLLGQKVPNSKEFNELSGSVEHWRRVNGIMQAAAHEEQTGY